MSIDLECYSSVDLKECGLYKYAESPDAEILLFGYSVNGDPVKVVDVACGEKIPDDILRAIADQNITKWAWNASFERIFLSIWMKRNYPQYFEGYGSPDDTVGNYLNPVSWCCTMTWAAYLGLPLSLDAAGAALKLSEQKMSEGKSQIRFFSVPRTPTKNNPATRNYPLDDIEKWETFKAYNKRDVEVEMQIQHKQRNFPVPDFVWEEYHLSEMINDRGILIDTAVAENAIDFDRRTKNELMARMIELTGLGNPNSTQQLTGWLKEKGIETDSLDKKAVIALLEDCPDDVAEVLRLRQQVSRSSVKKYQKMMQTQCADGRARGMFQFYGANRTGRFAGRHIQLQNLPKNHMDDLAEARAIVKNSDYRMMSLLYEDIPDTLSQLIRTAFIPKPGYDYIVCDFSAIEARVLAFLAGEQWRLDVFSRGDDIYCASASAMFKVPVEKHGQNSELRQKGKVAELACIAEGELVLTNHGLIPIESVTLDDLVWDGKEFVAHEGVIYKGEREVITYEGLTATPDHLVFIEGEQEPVQFGIAAASGSHLIQTGDGRRAIRLGEDYKPGKKMERKAESLLCSDEMPGLRNGSVAESEQPDQRALEGMPELLSARTCSKMADEKAHCRETTMRKPIYTKLLQLWRQRNKIRFPKCTGGRSLFDRYFRNSGQEHGAGSHRRQWGLRSWKYQVCHEGGESGKSQDNRSQPLRTGILALFRKRGKTEAFGWADKGRYNSGCRDCCGEQAEKLAYNKRTARLYDIRNAGRHHRFTVSGKLVHNCGYGGSVGAMKAMGGLEMGLTEDELQTIVNNWRNSNPRIVQFWWDVDRCVKETIRERMTTQTHGIKFSYKSGMMFILLPSGRSLAYAMPRIGENKFGGESVTYMGTDSSKKWSRIESYGPKFVENIVQAISRDILVCAMQSLSDYYIVGHVHDEVIIECSPETTIKEISELMGRTPPWLPGIELLGNGYRCAFYMKD